ncbi:hypothetical protein EGI16_21310 [Chryseobacterium sp. G0240]|uniref:hypothetical protein n=1 Tax=Chryseobacterium sp. G0240 TaxID=2487066 RepID=UPI000F45151B|nr:hypothetical protein [Chryseobacterium sp. G0240]ROH98376.1 hypothetical protein EGI16_21310 [Chryseobacterium sp. G0240]
MDKPTKKRQTYNTEIINVLSDEFEVSTRFVRMAINKEKHSRTADNIRKKYYEILRPTQEAIEKFKNQ